MSHPDNKEIQSENINNFIAEVKGTSSQNQGKMVPFIDVKVQSLIERFSKYGYLIFMLRRNNIGINSPDTYNNFIGGFLDDIKKSEFAFLPIYCKFTQSGESEPNAIYDRCFVLYCINRDIKQLNFQELFDFGTALSKKYCLSTFLMQAPNDVPKCVAEGISLVKTTTGNLSINDVLEHIFHDINNESENKKECSDVEGIDYTYDGAYINPSPACYSERFVRYARGEVFLGR